MTRLDPSLEHLPGADLVAKGLADLAAGVESPESWLVAIGAVRLRWCGVDVPAIDEPEPELHLYRLLNRLHPEDAYSRYNALLRRLASFVHALDARIGRELRRARGS